MGLLDDLLGQVAGSADVRNLAEKVGLTPEQVAQAVQALGAAHPQLGDTVATASADTGIPAETMQQILEHLGGEGTLTHLAGTLAERAASGGLGGMLGNIGGMFGKA